MALQTVFQANAFQNNAFQAMIRREFAADNLNAIVNHPDVRPWVGGGTHLMDFTPLVRNPANVLLMSAGGGLIFIQHEPGIYEVHTQFLPDHRGRAAIEVTRECLRWMFTKTDAVEMLAKVPEGNAAALGLVRAIKGEFRFERENGWETSSGPVSCGFWGLGIQRWAGSCEALKASGEWFHDRLEEAKKEKGATIPPHADDEAHDLYVGATVEMILAGQVEKAIRFYTQWARFAGYGMIRVIADNPLTIDIGDAIVAVRGQDFEVLLCR